jgi:hypothetical protein
MAPNKSSISELERGPFLEQAISKQIAPASAVKAWSSDDCADPGSTLPTYLKCRNNAETVHVTKHHCITSKGEFRLVSTQTFFMSELKGRDCQPYATVDLAQTFRQIHTTILQRTYSVMQCSEIYLLVLHFENDI